MLFVGIVAIPPTVTWQPKSRVIASEKLLEIKAGGSAYFERLGIGLPQESRDYVLKGNASEVAGKKFNFYIFDYFEFERWMWGFPRSPIPPRFEKKNITSTSFSVRLTRQDATSPIYFVVENPLLNANETVRFSAILEWNEAKGEWPLGGGIAFLGIIVMTIAGVATFKPKIPTPRLSFVIFLSLYFFVLLFSYLLALFYPFFILYGWCVIPLVVNFFLGYLVREADTATKIIVASFLLQTVVAVGLLNVPIVYETYLSRFTPPWSMDIGAHPFASVLTFILCYPIMQILFGIVVSSIGITVREGRR